LFSFLAKVLSLKEKCNRKKMECEPTPLHGGVPRGAVADVIDSFRLEGSVRLEESFRLEVEQSLKRHAVSANISAAAFCAAAGMFCQSVLKLQQQGSSGPRECLLVQEVLPSFPVALSACNFPVSALATELESWREQAGRLDRLAASLCREHGTKLRESLGKAEQHAGDLIEVLVSSCRESNTDQRPASDGNSTSPRVLQGKQLERMCRAVLGLLPSSLAGEAPILQIFPSAQSLFQGCTPEMTQQLRLELAASRSAIRSLTRIAGVHCPPARDELKGEAVRAHAEATALIDAFEVLQICRRATANAGRRRAEPSASAGLPGAVAKSGETHAAPSQRAPSHRFVKLLHRLGRRCQRQRYWDAAEVFYSAVLHLDKMPKLAYLRRGQVRLAGGRPQEAIADLTHALQLCPGDRRGLRCRGEAFMAAGRFHEALADFTRALQEVPSCLQTQMARAAALRELGQLDAAWRELERLESAGLQSAGLHLERGEVLLAQGEFEQATAEFHAALALDPAFSPALQGLQRAGLGQQERGEFRSGPSGDSPPQPRSEKSTVPAQKRATPVAAPETAKGPIAGRSTETDTTGGDGHQTARGSARRSKSPAGGQPGVNQAKGSGGQNRTKKKGPRDANDSNRNPPPRSKPSQAAATKSKARPSRPESRPATESDGKRPSTPSRQRESPPAERADRLAAAALDGIRTGRSKIPLPPAERPSGAHSDAVQFRVEIRCPECKGKSSLLGNQVQPGRIITCPRCRQKLAVGEGGQLTKATRTASGRWQAEIRQTRWSRRGVLAATWGATAAAVLIALAAGMFAFQEKPGPAVAQFSDELEPRAEAFGQALLREDYQAIHSLTLPAEQGELFAWLRGNRAARDARHSDVQVAVVEQGPNSAVVELKFASPRSSAPSPQFQTVWRREDNRWLFAPASARERNTRGPPATPLGIATRPATRRTASESRSLRVWGAALARMDGAGRKAPVARSRQDLRCADAASMEADNRVEVNVPGWKRFG